MRAAACELLLAVNVFGMAVPGKKYVVYLDELKFHPKLAFFSKDFLLGKIQAAQEFLPQDEFHAITKEQQISSACEEAQNWDPVFLHNQGRDGVKEALNMRTVPETDAQLAQEVLNFYPENGIVGFDLYNPKHGRGLFTQSSTLPLGNRQKQGLMRQRGFIAQEHVDHPGRI